MCELTDSRGDFWRRIHAYIVKPVRFSGYVFHRRHDEQALIEKQAIRRADAAVRELRALEASDKALADAVADLPFELSYRRHELRHALLESYRSGNESEIGRIVSNVIRAVLEAKAEDAAADEYEDIELAERNALERSAA